VNDAPTSVVFDLGGVLIDWDPRHLYRDLIPDEAAMEAFLTDVVGQPWNRKQDAGRPIADANAELIARFPQHKDLIEAYYGAFDRMMRGPIDGTVEVLEVLCANNVPVYALTNWSAETFPLARERFGFLDLFKGIVVSGEEGLRKPDAAIFELLCERFDLEAEDTLFIDDHRPNVEAAEKLGFHTVLFSGPSQLRGRLTGWGLLPPR
jgi:2-haloacid dehalogenase